MYDFVAVFAVFGGEVKKLDRIVGIGKVGGDLCAHDACAEDGDGLDGFLVHIMLLIVSTTALTRRLPRSSYSFVCGCEMTRLGGSFQGVSLMFSGRGK